MSTILSYDLGTGGVKACLFAGDGTLLQHAFAEYATEFPQPLWQEQKPADWWNALIRVTRCLEETAADELRAVEAIGVSGHSLGVVAIDAQGELVLPHTPIWSDGRARAQANAYFHRASYEEWYRCTGGGFPAQLYAAFKLLWYKETMPEAYENACMFLGSKDYINFRLTGTLATDFSYASGSGIYDLRRHQYDRGRAKDMGISAAKFPEPVPSTQVLGVLTEQAARELRLPQGAKVVAGSVDNACMALGANCFREGQSYTSLGTSAWVAVSSSAPVIDPATLPYVFEHCVPGQYVSATCIFSAGRSFRWIRDNFCTSIASRAQAQGEDAYDWMTQLAARSPVGANRLLFHPALSGGSAIDPAENMRGCLLGLDLRHTLSDVIRAAMEGIALNLRVALDALRKHTQINAPMLLVGGGAKSALWRQIFADAYEMDILETAVGQNAGALGAAALAALGTGLWSDFAPIERAHVAHSLCAPILENATAYQNLLPVFCFVARQQAALAERLAAL